MTHAKEDDDRQLAALIRKYSYQNPYWSIPQRLLNHPDLLSAARVITVEGKIAKYWWRTIMCFAIPFWIIAGVSFFRDLVVAERDEFGNLLENEFRSTLTNWLLGTALAIFVALSLFRLWVGKRRMSAKSLIRAISREEYRTWRTTIAVGDPSRYSDVLRWEQNEKMLAMQGLLAAQQMRQSQELSRIQRELDESRKKQK
jgi:hypothetical protein